MSESIENTYAQTLNAILDYVTGEQQVSAAPIKLVINKTFELVEESKKWNTRAESNPLNWDECVKLAAKLQIISITLMAERKLNNDAKTVDEWLKEAIPIEQKLYAEAIQAALPSETAKDQRIRELEAKVEEISMAHNNQGELRYMTEQTIAALQAEIYQANKDRQSEHDLRVKFQGENETLQAKVKELEKQKEILFNTNHDAAKDMAELINLKNTQQAQIEAWGEALEDVEKQFATYEKDGNRYSEASIYLKISKVRQALAKYPAKQKE